MPDGKLLVAEKRGVVWVVEGGLKHSTPMWSHENEVENADDRGLLDVAVDPNFATNRYVYFLYSVDPDSNGVDTDNNAFGRLTRYQVKASDPYTVDPATRTILMGVDWRHGQLEDFPSHSIGSLRWGADGSLLVSAGDGASYSEMDPGGLDQTAFGPGKTDPYEDIGAFRAQYIGSLCGKILRLNPADGHGYPSNPYYDGDPTSVQSRVWAYGVRNPFRFGVRPGTGSLDPALGDPGTLYIGDVGWELREEISVANAPGMNFGWPCYEGDLYRGEYQNATPDHNDCASVGSPSNPATPTPPLMDWDHGNPDWSSPPGFIGNAVTGAVFYTGSSYPAGFQGACFISDFGQNWIRVITVNGSDQLQTVQLFGTDMSAPVDMVTDPVSGDIYYVAISANQVRRIRYTAGGGNLPPVAVADGTPTVGVAPLTVNFSSAGSYDPNGDPLTFAWTFGDNGTSSDPAPTHQYLTSGTYTAVLTVFDNHGAQASDNVIVRATATGVFPTTGVLDDFNRADGAIGGAWTGDTGGLSIQSNALVSSGAWASTVWDGGVFGPDQEAFISFDALNAGAPEHDLMLKLQGTSWSAGHVEVRYDATNQTVGVNTYDPGQGWVGHGHYSGITFSAGDQLGARAYSDGTVEIYKNGALIGSESVASWPYYSLGGRLGLTLDSASSSQLDNFGGGDAALAFNTPPTATIVEPADSSFYHEGEIIHLIGVGTDAEDDSASLTYRWQFDLHHNNHVHPSAFVSSSPVDSFLAENHDDGTGVHFEGVFVVTDTGFLADTAHVILYADVDLSVSPVVTLPVEPGTASPAQFQFVIRNMGTMPAPISHWMMTADDFVLAQGDTIVPALDSVTVTRVLPPTLAAGNYDLRAAADSADTVHETDETNNGSTCPLTVVEGTVGAPSPVPSVLAVSPSQPNPSRGMVSFRLSLPRAADVQIEIVDVQGRVVWRDPARRLAAGSWALGWHGTTRSGTPVPPGIYLARFQVDDRALVRRVTILR
jgi:glucose/arabinose dehydrogenase